MYRALIDMLFMILIALYNIETSAKLFPDQSHEISSLANCVYDVYNLHQNFYKTTIVIYENESEENIPDNLFKETIMKKVIENKNPLIITNNLYELTQIKYILESTVLIVVNLKSCSELKATEFDTFHIKLRYIIIIIDIFLTDECFIVLKTKLSKFSHYDVTFITDDKRSGKYNFIAAIPEIDAVTCNTTESDQIKFINACTNDTLDEKKLTHVFPLKAPSNFKLCNFNVGMTILFPYAMVNNKNSLNDLDDSVKFYGADIEIMKIMANIFNSTLKLFYVQRNDYNPYLRKDLVQYFLNGTLDACAGGLYRIYGDKVSYSGVYSRQTVIWVYTVERDRRTWQSLIVKMSGLYLFLIIYQCYVILWNLINKFEHQAISLPDSFVYGWGALFGATGLQDARTLKQKFLNIVYLITCLHLSAYVSTQIYYYLTIDRPPHYFTTVDELRSSDRIPYLITEAKYFVDDKKHIAFANTSRQCYNFTNCEELIIKNKGSTIIIDGLLAPLQSASAVNDEARVLPVPEDILVIYHEIILRKKSPIVRNFQKYTQRLFEAGICQKLYVEAIGITVVDKAKIANQNILSNSYSCTVGCEITLSQITGVFYIWMVGCCFSCLVFILEVLMKIPLLTKNNHY